MKNSIFLFLVGVIGFGGVYTLSYVNPNLLRAGYQQTCIIIFFILVVGSFILQEIEDLEEKVEKLKEEGK